MGEYREGVVSGVAMVATDPSERLPHNECTGHHDAETCTIGASWLSIPCLDLVLDPFKRKILNVNVREGE
jgi:hypothetical protein